ncbi:protein LIFEGUARD 4-like [Cornus florida]|uniref:protein LIFEGUARD 4-like n=1 Tax=Cornus florida TaxID=4283 RepID=UPI0028987129|nr:protein LIFEGUARD 4-like [Cornus florida]
MGKSGAEKNDDIEAGNNDQLYPNMMEKPEHRWAFIRKVYVIISIQLFITVGVASAVVFTTPISDFIRHTTAGITTYVAIIILTVILIVLLHMYQTRHPLNLILLVTFTVLMAFSVGLSCSFSKGKIILEAAILTVVVVVSLTLNTFWAVKRGQDFNFLGPFLFAVVLVMLTFSLMQIFFPLGKLGLMIWGCVGAIVYSGFILYDTDNLIKRYNYDQYVPAAVALFLDIINLFLSLLAIFTGADK